MTVFIDTSAFVALMNADDRMNPAAQDTLEELFSSDAVLFTSNYVLLETSALIQCRLGMEALNAFHADILPLVVVKWVDESIHRTGMNTVLAAGRKQLSLVDCVSFDVMRTRGITSAFTFDQHFAEQGFVCIPAG